MNRDKQGAALLSVVSNLLLTGSKVAVGIVSGSVGIISEAIHSGIDLLASFIAFFSVRYSDQPADQGHPYGHGKIENVSGVVEGLLIFLAAGWIIAESVHKLRHGGRLESLGLGVLVMGVSALVNLAVSRYLYQVARRTDSVALEADAAHLRTDVYTSAGVFAAVGLIYLSHRFWDFHLDFLDPLIALGVAAFILSVAGRITRKSFLPLLDARAVVEEKRIQEILAPYRERVSHFHQMRTRRSGSALHVDLHMGLPGDRQLAEAHALSHEIKAQIQAALPHAQVLIHVEPPEGKDRFQLDPQCECRDQVVWTESAMEVKRCELAPTRRLQSRAPSGFPLRVMVATGEAEFFTGRTEKTLRPGQEMEIPAGQTYSVSNSGREPLVWLEIMLRTSGSPTV